MSFTSREKPPDGRRVERPATVEPGEEGHFEGSATTVSCEESGVERLPTLEPPEKCPAAVERSVGANVATTLDPDSQQHLGSQEKMLQRSTGTIGAPQLANAVLINGIPVYAEEIGAALAPQDYQTVLRFLAIVTRSSRIDQLRGMLTSLEIRQTPSAFVDENREQLEILETISAKFPFLKWLKDMGMDLKNINRNHFYQWWETFVQMTTLAGYAPFGLITDGKTILWKATGNLAIEIEKNKERYKFLPAELINDPGHVKEAMDHVTSAVAFIELLTGEWFRDLEKSPKFLNAFSFIEEGGENPVQQAVYSVALALQRKC